MLLPHYIGGRDPMLRMTELGPVPPGKDVFLLTRSRDRKDLSLCTVAPEMAIMCAQDHALCSG